MVVSTIDPVIARQQEANRVQEVMSANARFGLQIPGSM
jgi:hypothetical protein